MNFFGRRLQYPVRVDSPDPLFARQLQQHILSSGPAAKTVNSGGVPFDCSHIYASGNLAADMYANSTTERTGRILAVRLYHAAQDDGMKDMLSFLIGCDTVRQQQWLAVIEETGGAAALPIPNSFDQAREQGEYSYAYSPAVTR